MIEIKVDREKITYEISAKGKASYNLAELSYGIMRLLNEMVENIANGTGLTKEKAKEMLYEELIKLIKIAKDYEENNFEEHIENFIESYKGE